MYSIIFTKMNFTTKDQIAEGCITLSIKLSVWWAYSIRPYGSFPYVTTIASRAPDDKITAYIFDPLVSPHPEITINSDITRFVWSDHDLIDSIYNSEGLTEKFCQIDTIWDDDRAAIMLGMEV
jgi:hypothetical protein